MKTELRFLFSANCLMLLYICTKFSENILYGFTVIERTLCPYLKYKEAYFRKKYMKSYVFFIFCTLSDYA